MTNMDQKTITILRKLITNLKLETDNADLQFTHYGRKVYDDSIDYTLKLTIASSEIYYSELYHISYYTNHLILNKRNYNLKVFYADLNEQVNQTVNQIIESAKTGGNKCVIT